MDIAPAYIVLAISAVAQGVISWANQKYLNDLVKDHEARIRSLERFQYSEEAIDRLERGKV